MSRSGRLLSLVELLRAKRRPVTAGQLAQELAVSQRTIYRDIAELMAQGTPIEGSAGLGYVIKSGYFLPPLMFDREEIEAIMLGLRYVDQRGDQVLVQAAATALAKMQAVLPDRAIAALQTPLAMPGPAAPAYPANTVALSFLRQVIRDQHRIDIVYTDAEGKQSRRWVWPLQIGFMDSARVLAAWCELRSAFRTFRTDRIVAAHQGTPYPGRRAELMRGLHEHLALAAKQQATDRN